MSAKHRLRCHAALATLELAIRAPGLSSAWRRRLVRLAARLAPPAYGAQIELAGDAELDADLGEIRRGGW